VSASGQRALFIYVPPQHRLYFLPEPQGHISFRPVLGEVRKANADSSHAAIAILRPALRMEDLRLGNQVLYCPPSVRIKNSAL
jgi:hypothetical protein